MQAPNHALEQLFTRLQGAGLTTWLIGCSREEIERLERLRGCRFPATYRWFLRTMGRDAGKLFRYDHVACLYGDLLGLPEIFAESMAEGAGRERAAFRLPSNAALIAGRLASQYHFVICDNDAEGAVFYVNTWEQQPRLAYAGVTEWLSDHVNETLRVVESGYFAQNPHGTRP